MKTQSQIASVASFLSSNVLYCFFDGPFRNVRFSVSFYCIMCSHLPTSKQNRAQQQKRRQIENAERKAVSLCTRARVVCEKSGLHRRTKEDVVVSMCARVCARTKVPRYLLLLPMFASSEQEPAISCSTAFKITFSHRFYS